MPNDESIADNQKSTEESIRTELDNAAQAFRNEEDFDVAIF